MYATVFVAPRSKRSHCPSPLADQRVFRLPSTTFAGTLPSLLLAVTEDPGMAILTPPVVISLTTTSLSCVGGLSQAIAPAPRARAAVPASRRGDEIQLLVILERSFFSS